MKHTLSLSAPLYERIRYNPASVSTEEIVDALKAYEALLDAVNRSDLDTLIDVTDCPQDVTKEINGILERTKNEAVESNVRNLYKDFFDDCVGALNGYWPDASIEDDDLRSAILEAIERGES